MIKDFFSRDDYETYLKERLNNDISFEHFFSDIFVKGGKPYTGLYNENISNKDFIELIAKKRIEGYDEATGNGNSSAQKHIGKMYSNTPWKFVEEFLQNADDCKYDNAPELTIFINEQENFVEFVYNEIGFSRKDIWALTSFDRSTKSDKEDSLLFAQEQGVFYREKTGRKGLGFKSVFSLDSDQIILHIKSNGYSFKLDKQIGEIIPIWEDYDNGDNKTHIKVQLSDVKWFKNIYEEFRKLFGLDDVQRIFSKNPIIFMHRIKSLKIYRTTISGECASFGVDIKSVKEKYFNEFTPIGSFLAGISNNGKYYKKQIANLIINLNNEIEIPCVRITKTIYIDGYYRNISMIAPVMKILYSNKWEEGALFRTFPIYQHQFKMPFSIDAPFELNDSRHGLDFTKDNEAFNNQIRNAVFEGKESLFSEFLMYLREIPEIRMDYYFTNEDIILFKDPSNLLGDSYVVSVVNINDIFKELPLFKICASDKYEPLKNIVSIKPEIYEWQDANIFVRLIEKSLQEKKISSSIYANSSLIKCINIINKNFINNTNYYLDYLEEEYGLKNKTFYAALHKIYNWCNNSNSREEIKSYGGIKKIKMYLFNITEKCTEYLVRETLDDKNKVYFSDFPCDKKSFCDFRVFASSPIVDNEYNIMMQHSSSCTNISSFFERNINKKYKEYTNNTWEKIKDFIKATYYYTNNKNIIYNIDMDLSSFTISNAYVKDNIFAEYEICTIIPERDIQDLANTLHIEIKDVLNFFETKNLNTGNTFFIDNGNDLSYQTYQAFDKIETDKVIELWKKIIESNKKINIEYSKIDFHNYNLIREILKSEHYIDDKSYSSFCFDCFNDENIWCERSNIASDIILRACIGIGKKQNFRETVEIDIEYLVNEELEGIAKKCVEEYHIGKIIIVNSSTKFDKLDNGTVRAYIPEYKEDSTVYYGKMNEYFINDSNGNIYLKNDDTVHYSKSLKKCFDVKEKFSRIKIEAADRISEINKKVYDTILNNQGQDQDGSYRGAYDRYKKNNFDDLTNEAFIDLLTYFRSHSYDEGAGNASKNNEAEIEKDYSKEPWKFVYEFIQNVDDCIYCKDVIPKISVKLDENAKSISFEYNESGFTRNDILAITQFGNSDKSNRLDDEPSNDGIFDRECTGRKGRGFKSVFALPGKDIVVHIRSNGYSFKFVKSVGQIIPIWEGNEVIPENGTQILIEGIDNIKDIYEKLQDIFCVANTKELFSKCPVLFLRKLKNVMVENMHHDKFGIKMKIANSIYGEKINVGTSSVISGIKYKGNYVQKVLNDIVITIYHNNDKGRIEAKQLSMMFDATTEFKIASVIVPIMLEKGNVFTKGSLYRTLPLEENDYCVPLAINAPFLVDVGRKKVDDNKKDVTMLWINNIFDELLPNIYNEIKKIDGINICKYYALKDNNILFGEKCYKLTKEFNINECIRSYPILKCYDNNEYVCADQAIVLPKKCYKWENVKELKESFCKDENLKLVDGIYNEKELGLESIHIITEHFCEDMNDYLNKISQNVQCGFIGHYIYPYIIEERDKIIKEIGDKSKLKNIKMFIFTMYDGSVVREEISDENIYLKDLPNNQYSIGIYRSFNNTAIKYTKEMFNLLDELGVKTNKLEDVFSSKKINEFKFNSWKEASAFITAIVYYGYTPCDKILYFRKCVLPEDYSEDNIFRLAYSECASNDILQHVITEEEIIVIASKLEKYVNSNDHLDLVIETIRKLGCNIGDDFFKEKKESDIRLNSWTKALIKTYCNTRERSNCVINKIIDKYMIERNSDRKLNINYKDIKESDNEFFAAFFACDKLEKYIKNEIAEKFINDDSSRKNTGIAYKEAFIRAIVLLDDKNVQIKKDLTFKLTEIVERKLGDILKDVTINLKENVNVDIVSDSFVEKYESLETTKAIEWINTGNNTSVSYRYIFYTLDLSAAFTCCDGKGRYLISTDRTIYLDVENPKLALLEAVKAIYGKSDKLYTGYIEIIQLQNILKSEWTRSKNEYINNLAEFRKICKKYEDTLCPNAQDHINLSTSDPLEYMVPELLQNINDCKKTDVCRILRIKLDTKTCTMELQYEESGFDFGNVYSITALGQSSKHDASEGEKGLGFKKVFTLFDEVDIYSNGFNFNLKGKSNTVPNLIENPKYNFQHGTIMVFKANSKDAAKKTSFNKLVEKWKELYSDSITTVSPLFLKNIDEYNLIVDEGEAKKITRNEIVDKYILKEYNIIDEYDTIFDNDNNNWESIQEEIRKDFRQRRKCSVEAMTDEMLNDYIKGLSLSIAIPKNITKDNGYFYSSLSTKDSTNMLININLPLELSTGRDTILENSVYNKRIFKLVFGTEYTYNTSVFYHILESLYRERIQIFKYIHKDINSFLNLVTKYTEEDIKIHYNILNGLYLFKQLSNGEDISLSLGYTVDDIMYQYVKNVDGVNVKDFEKWLSNNIKDIQEYAVIDYSGKEMLENINRFANNINLNSALFPVTTSDIVLKYFANEYGKKV